MSVFICPIKVSEKCHFLLPKRGMMLIVFHLYHRMKEQEMERTFTEEDIKKSIRVVQSHLRTEQSEQWNQVIRALQKYFLWRDVEQGMYRFRAYAWQLCEGVEKVLYDTFNPTQIESYFKYIQNTLQWSGLTGGISLRLEIMPGKSVRRFQHWIARYLRLWPILKPRFLPMRGMMLWC